MLVLVVISGSAGVFFLNIFMQLPFSDEFLYLLLQVSAIFYVMAVILVETVIFLFITHIW